MRRIITVLTMAAVALAAVATAASAGHRQGQRPGYRLAPRRARFQYQLQPVEGHEATGGVNVDVCEPAYGGGPCVRPKVWGIDLYEADGVTPNRRAVDAIHARGGYALCYVDAGSIENYRPDWPEFEAWNEAHGRSLLGKPYSELFPEEFWANLNNDQGQRDFLLSMQEKRVEKCRTAGFDAVDFDVVDAFAAGADVTGWDISYETQLIFNRALARIAHRNRMAVVLKADLLQVRDLVRDFDMAVNESCFVYDECEYLLPFVRAGKPVFELEYDVEPADFCDRATRFGFNAIKKSADQLLLDLPWTPCR